jgi:S-adenosylmethionine-diacylglycerol 3-amino-3-carboxypropyl transferase
VELKAAAFRALDYDRLLGFLGVRDSRDRPAVFRELRGQLSDDARSFWNARPEAIAGGVIHCGKFERYFRLFRRLVLPLIHRRATVHALLQHKSQDERERFYHTVWNNRRWRLLFRFFFGRRMMGWLGRDPEFFRFVEIPVSERILDRTRYAFTVLPTHDNPYLAYVMNGNWGMTLPDYLRPENFDRVRQSLASLQLFLGPVEEAAETLSPGSFDVFNLSDIFEYVDLAGYHALLERLLRSAAAGARLVYWNMLVPRRRPESMAGRLEAAADEAKRLHRLDRAFFYQDLVIEVAK